MTPGTIGGSIRIEAPPELRLRSGDSVVLTVIKRLDPGKWAIGIRGRVYPAFSDLALEPGAKLRARVDASLGKIVLTVAQEQPDPVRVALQGQGISPGGLAELVARAMARSGLPISARTVERAISLLSRTKLDPRKGARLVATLVDRGIDLSSPGVDALLAVLAFGEKGGEQPAHYRGRRFPEGTREVKEFVASLPAAGPGSRPSALQAYNHSKGRAQTWVVVPFLFRDGGEEIAGTLKILYDPFLSRPLRFALCSEGINFHLPLEGKSRTLTVYCDGEKLRRAAARGLDTLRAKFHNMGFEVDDTVNEGDGFDGFSPVGEGIPLHSVDTVG